MKRMGLVCLALGVFALSAMGCSSSGSSSDDSGGGGTGTLTTVPDVVTGAETIMPKISDTGASASIYSMAKAWQSGDKTTYRNDPAFNVGMRFMDPNSATFTLLDIGNESMFDNLQRLFAPGYINEEDGTQTVIGGPDNGQMTMTIGEAIAVASDVASPFAFGRTPFTGYEYARKFSSGSGDGPSFTDYVAWVISDANLLHIVDSSTEEETNLVQATVMLSNFDNTSKDLNFYYISNNTYSGALIETRGKNFIIRMDLEGNESTKAFTMQTTLREIKEVGSLGSAGGFAMVAKGVVGADGFIAVKEKNGCAGTDSADWLDLMDASFTKWFCMKSELTYDEFDQFVKSGVYDNENNLTGYTNMPGVIEMQDSYSAFTVSPDCVTYGAAIDAIDYIPAADSSMPSSQSTYQSTFGVE